MPAATLSGGARHTGKGQGTERPLQKGHISQQLKQFGGSRIALGAAAAMCQNDKGKVGPARLALDPCGDLPEITKTQSLFGNNGEPDIVTKKGTERGQIAGDFAGYIKFPEQVFGNMGIPSLRRQNEC
ncbi:hypothetical protein [Pararhizobium gei]|uniref:hypothetical protein n=1 Tax=Pararhizobium gei TaxID=1395951 RepID=UPI0023DA122E|nr:hypothetical protein [Rhizobium gei]